MRNVLTSILIGLCLFLGNISGQAKSYKLVSHIAMEHSEAHSHDGEEHHHHHDKESKKEHSHHCELSVLTVLLVMPVKQIVPLNQTIPLNNQKSFYNKNELRLLSFSPHIFRPPIA